MEGKISQKAIEEVMVRRHTLPIYETLKSKKAAIAGLGGLGSNIAVMLARAGVGELLLVDFDKVDLSNLNRQHYFIRHLGMKKTEALLEQLKEINPYMTVKTIDQKVTEANISELFRGCPVICEAFDLPEAKAMLVNTILSTMPETKIISGSGMAGYASSNSIRTSRKMKNLYVCGDYESDMEECNGLMAPRVQVCAGHQANMALRLLLGLEDT